MTSRWPLWIGLTVLLAGSAAGLSWVIHLWSSSPTDDATSEPARAATAPARPAMPTHLPDWAPSRARSDDRPNQPVEATHDDDAACGPKSIACAADSSCVEGECVLIECAADGGVGARCTMLGGRKGGCCGDRCTDLSADLTNCGQCGTHCPAGQACAAGQCQASSCTGQMAGAACTIPGHGSGACCRSTCVDRVSWASDRANCGSCGHACAPGLACNRGVCVDPSTGAPPAWTCLEDAHACPPGTFCVMESCVPKTCGGDNDGVLCPTARGGELGHCCGQTCSDLFEDHENCGICGKHCAPSEACKNGECTAP